MFLKFQKISLQIFKSPAFRNKEFRKFSGQVCIFQKLIKFNFMDMSYDTPNQ